MEGKKLQYIEMHIYRYKPHQSNKIIDGWQVLKGDFSRYKQLLPKMQACIMAELRKRKRKWNPRCHPVAGEFNIRWQHLILFDLCTLFSGIKKIR